MLEGGLTQRTWAGLEWAGVSVVLQGAASLPILAVLSRLLAPGDFGVVAMTHGFVTLAELAVRGGIGPALIQRTRLTARHVSAGLALSTAAGALLAAAIFGLAPLLGRLLAEPTAAPVLAALSAAVLIAGLGCAPEALLRRALRFRSLATVELLALIFGYGAVAIALAQMGLGVWALVWGILARHAVFTAAATAASGGWPMRVRPGLREAGELLRTGAAFASGSQLSLLGGQAAQLVIGRWLGAAALGHYTLAQRLASLRGAPGAVLARVLFPSMARRQHRAERLAEIWLHGTEIMSLLALPAAILLAVAAPEIVAVVLGGQWQAAVPVLQIFALAAPFRFCDTVNRPPPRALGAAWRLAWRQAAHAALLVSAVWAGSRWGLAGAAAGAACAQAAAYLLTSQLALKLLGERWGRLARCHCPALWAGAWVVPALGLSAALARKAELPVAAALGAEILACGAAASLAVWYAPGFARPAFPGWALANLPFDAVGRPGRWLEPALAALARRHGR